MITVVETTSHPNALCLVMRARLLATEPRVDHVMAGAVEALVVEVVVAVVVAVMVADPAKARDVALVETNMGAASMPHPNPMKPFEKLVGKYIVLAKNVVGIRGIISTPLVDIMLRKNKITSCPTLSRSRSRRLSVGLLKQGPKPPMMMVAMRSLPQRLALSLLQ